MVTIIGGPNGSGKTQQLINKANNDTKDLKGLQVYIDNKAKYQSQIDNGIRFINTSEFAISSPEMFFGFICGLIGGNYDIDTIYIDNIGRIIEIDCNETATAFLEQLEEFTKSYEVKIVLTMNVDTKEEQEYLSKYSYQLA